MEELKSYLDSYEIIILQDNYLKVKVDKRDAKIVVGDLNNLISKFGVVNKQVVTNTIKNKVFIELSFTKN